MEIRLWWTRQQVEPSALQGCTVTVVDCLRATTTIAAALAAGCTAVLPVEEEAAARHLASARGAVLAGERECLPPPGFDLGNSPGGCTSALAGREMVLWTTNGSRALSQAATAGGPVVALALVNAGATAAYLRQSGCARLAIVCAGTEGKFALDDAFAAGALIDRLASDVPPGLDERALSALLLYRGGRGNPRAVLDGTAAAAKLRALGLEADVAFAARPDALDVVALWQDGALRPAPSATLPAG